MKITYKNVKKFSYAGSILSIILVIVFYLIRIPYPKAAMILAFLAIILMLLSLGLLYRFDICPYCGASFARMYENPEYCPRCGKKLV